MSEPESTPSQSELPLFFTRINDQITTQQVDLTRPSSFESQNVETLKKHCTSAAQQLKTILSQKIGQNEIPSSQREVYEKIDTILTATAQGTPERLVVHAIPNAPREPVPLSNTGLKSAVKHPDSDLLAEANGKPVGFISTVEGKYIDVMTDIGRSGQKIVFIRLREENTNDIIGTVRIG